MKRECGLAAVVAAAAFVGTAAAEPTVVFADGPGNVGGGEFTAVTSDHGTFRTFCMEYEEDLDIVGGTTYEYEISTAARFNGLGQGNENPLDARTAFIFQRFVDGDTRDLIGDQGLSDERVANAIQLAIWDVEDQGVDFSFHPDFANAQTLIAAAQSAIDNNTWTGIGNVRVMNNWVPGQIGETAGARQDTLIIVPLPSGAALAGAGLLGLASFRRRRG